MTNTPKGLSRYLYTCFRINFAAYPVKTQISSFVDLGLLTINALYEGRGLSTLATRIRIPADGAHWSIPNHISGKTTVGGVSDAKYDYDNNYKTELQLRKENKAPKHLDNLNTFRLDSY